MTTSRCAILTLIFLLATTVAQAQARCDGWIYLDGHRVCVTYPSTPAIRPTCNPSQVCINRCIVRGEPGPACWCRCEGTWR